MTIPILPSTPNPALIKTVCGGVLAGWQATVSAEYRGERVYFCRAACLRAFQADPDRFIRGEIEHPADETTQ